MATMSYRVAIGGQSRGNPPGHHRPLISTVKDEIWAEHQRMDAVTTDEAGYKTDDMPFSGLIAQTSALSAQLIVPTTTSISLDIGGKTIQLSLTQIFSGEMSSRLTRFVSNPTRWAHDMRFMFVDHNQYFIERPPSEAKIVSQYYSSGFVSQPRNMCPFLFYHILLFWGIPMKAVLDDRSQPMPLRRILRRRRSSSSGHSDVSLDTLQMATYQLQCEAAHETCAIDFFGSELMARLRRWAWLIVNDQKNIMGRLFTSLSLVFILMSLICLIVGSMPEFQELSYSVAFIEQSDSSQSKTSFLRESKQPVRPLIYMEYACLIWFTFEFCLRLAATHNPCRFMAKLLNIIDLLTILPFYLKLVFTAFFGGASEELDQMTSVMFVLRLLRVLRVARLLKMIRYSKALQVIVHSFTSSVQELTMFFMLTTTAIIFFATLIYFVECDVNPSLHSIPAACWWCVITMTIIGYGDVVPITALGKLVAAAASICGMIVLAFPVTMVVEKFINRQEEIVRHIEEQDRNDDLRRKATPARLNTYTSIPRQSTSDLVRKTSKHARFMSSMRKHYVMDQK